MLDEDTPLESDEEEVLVYVDFEGTAGPSIFSNEKLQLDMIGLDMEHPIMQVNGKYYEGTYEDAVGTYMFLEKDDNPVVNDPVFDKIPNVKYFTKARKILKMKRVFVKPRLEVLGDSNYPSCIPNMDTIKEAGIPPKYQREALSMWEQMRNERLDALNEYLEKQRQREKMREQGIEPDSESDEDNPFAMYKPVSVKSTEIVTEPKKDNEDSTKTSGNDQEKLTIIDPGPSTSKDSVPWSSPPADSSSNLEQSQAEVKPDNRGRVEVPKRRRQRREQTKRQCKKRDMINDVQMRKSESSDVLNDTLPNNDEKMDIDDEPPSNVVTTEIEKESLVAPAIDQDPINIEKHPPEVDDELSHNTEDVEMSVESLSPLNPDDVASKDRQTKKIEKQKKREAKMKEIAERLKKVTDEVKSEGQ